jgi:hypothetical protein
MHGPLNYANCLDIREKYIGVYLGEGANCFKARTVVDQTDSQDLIGKTFGFGA